MKNCQDCGEPLEHIPNANTYENLDRLVCNACGMAYEICSDCGSVIRRHQLQPGAWKDGEWGC